MFNIKQLLQATGGQLVSGQSDLKVKGVCIDSRKVDPGELFIAVKGDLFDGHDFLEDVIKRGARALIVHKPIKIDNPKVAVICVKDTVRALGDVARFHRLRFDVPVIALTGSAGKTTTKEMLGVVLAKKHKVLKNEGTQNNHIGVPLTLLKLRTSHTIVVLECGTNQPGDIAWLADVGRPDTVIFTNIGESHLEKLKTPSGVLKEKVNLTKFMQKGGTVVLNQDDALLSKWGQKAKALNIISYGIKQEADLVAKNITIIKGRYLSFTIGKENIELRSCGVNNIYNALAVFVVSKRYSVAPAVIAKALKSFDFPRGRGSIVPLGRGWLIDDTYNANPVSMRSALQTLDALNVATKKIFVAADMLELGAREIDLHRGVGKAVASSTVDVLITVGKRARYIASEARKLKKRLKVIACADMESAQRAIAGVLANGDAVLIKGSRRMKMEHLVDFLLAPPK